MCYNKNPLIPAVAEWMTWMNEWMNTHTWGEGEKEMHVRATLLASLDKLWISLFFWVGKMCENSIHNNNEDNNNDDK